ncbi:MAG: hypothetical protein H7330_15185 [Hymenobacteraceae bacterium]|nr:hypothetical protein [Hymenobacteraceae bacterium]
MRGYRKPAKDAMPDGAAPDPAGASAPSQAQTSFGSLLQMGRDALGTLKGMGDQYETDNPLVTVAALEAFVGALKEQDTTINDALTPLRTATRLRYALYEGEEGLKARMTAVKSHVAGAQKKSSPLYKDLVKIKY